MKNDALEYIHVSHISSRRHSYLNELENDELIFLRCLMRKGNCEAELCDSQNEITR